MRAEARAYTWAVVLLGAALLTSGCVTLAPQPGGGTSEGPRALSTLRETGASTPPLEAPTPLASTEASEHAFSAEPGEQERLHRRRSARGLGPDAALASSGEAPAYEVTSAGPAPQGEPSCGGQAVPPGWPDFSSGDSEALLAPFFTCASPAEFLALQERVDMPRLVEALGVRKPDSGLRYADVLVIEEGALGGRPRRVETFSFKSRDLSGLPREALTAQMIEDANEALRKYGETLDIRRDSLQSHLPEGSKLQVSRVRLIYQGGELKPGKAEDLEAAVEGTKRKVPGVEVLFQ